MFGLGWSELVLIGIVALIVVGPKDLPGLFRSVGQFTGKARGMAREFSKAMEDAARDFGIKDVEKTIRAAANPAKFGTDALRNSAMSAIKPGGETEKTLPKERDEMRARIEEATAKAATDRKAREAAARRPEGGAAARPPRPPSQARGQARAPQSAPRQRRPPPSPPQPVPNPHPRRQRLTNEQRRRNRGQLGPADRASDRAALAPDLVAAGLHRRRWWSASRSGTRSSTSSPARSATRCRRAARTTAG